MLGNKLNFYNLLVISADGNDWERQFLKKDLTDGNRVKVFTTSWGNLHVESSGLIGNTPKIKCRVPKPESYEMIEFEPHFVLFRAFPNDLFGVSYRNTVLSLYFSGIGSVNSLESVLRGMDRPVVHAEMIRIAEKVGKDKFPVVPAKFHPNLYPGNKQRLLNIGFPAVVKVGSSYGGYGKMVVKSSGDIQDLSSILALGTEFFTEEPFIEHEYEFRVQVIGPYVRCFRRNSDNNWKNQVGNIVFDDHPWSDYYKLWVDEVRQMFGGTDMFALDVLHNKGSDFILEVNDYAMGFFHDYEVEDLKWVRELVLQRMNEKLCGAPKKSYIGVFEFSKSTKADLKGKDYIP